MIVGELTFWETVTAGALNVLLTALLVGGLASILAKSYEVRAADRRREAEERMAERHREADKRHEEELQSRQLEHQARGALRQTYGQLLLAQRRSRETSLDAARGGGASRDPALVREAVSAHSHFIDLYHTLNLDASREMWEDARSLRNVLDDMLDAARGGDQDRCQTLVAVARGARQNLERSFRLRLGYEPLQRKRDLGSYNKTLTEGRDVRASDV